MLTHINDKQQPTMVDISDKTISWRSASAQATVILPEALRAHINNNEISTKKGPVFQTAIIAATMAVKKTADLIPFCHPIPVESCKIDITFDESMNLKIQSRVKLFAKTGAEMEALTAVNIAALTVFDMCKAVSSDIRIHNIELTSKTGGKTTRLDKPLYGLVLTGGKSQRMQSDKALLQYAAKPHAEHLRELLLPFCEEVYLSTRKNQWVGTALAELPSLEDVVEDLGPIGGLMTALQTKPDAYWLVVACDLPFVSKMAIEKLLANFDIDKTATCYANKEKGFPEALCAIYTPKALKVFEQAIVENISCPVKVLKKSSIELIETDHNINLANINTPEEHIQAKGSL